ncbi:MAG: serine/threonine protein kinase [Oscillospiraceae bacterium]|nr:serine/threonine protein kinase [Oscillospiraceae bacterium]
MNLQDKCVLSSYTEIATLNEAHNVLIVQHNISKNIFVKKTLTVYNPDVYRYLRDHRIRGIPEITELIEDGDSLIVIEEYVAGRTLRAILDDNGTLPEEHAIGITNQLCCILRQMHTADPVIVHRDIKPSNIIINSDGIVKLIDMNTAKYYSSDQSEDTSLLGTVGYAAPEQFGFGASDIRADIYSVGVLLNEMLVGVSPKGKLPEGRLADVIKKCTMMDPDDRYGSVDELLSDVLGSGQKPVEPERKYHRYYPPGFRSMDPSHIVLAVIGYLGVFGLSFSMATPQNPTLVNIWGQRITFVLSAVSVILFSCNYLNAWKLFKIDRIKNPLLKAFAVLMADVAILFIILLIMSFIFSK